jgi:hypothetical protein
MKTQLCKSARGKSVLSYSSPRSYFSRAGVLRKTNGIAPMSKGAMKILTYLNQNRRPIIVALRLAAALLEELPGEGLQKVARGLMRLPSKPATKKTNRRRRK